MTTQTMRRSMLPPDLLGREFVEQVAAVPLRIQQFVKAWRVARNDQCFYRSASLPMSRRKHQGQKIRTKHAPCEPIPAEGRGRPKRRYSTGNSNSVSAVELPTRR